jgi:sugar lactone lactonase YvrE
VDYSIIPNAIEMNGPIAGEDLAWDLDGHIVGSDMNHIWKSDYDGNKVIWVPNLPYRAGNRALSTGELIVCDDNQGRLVRVELDGSTSTLLGGLSYPNGLEIGLDDMVYVTEHDAQRVRRVDPLTGDNTVISSGEISSPNGISFNPDFSALYIAGFSGVGTIYRLPIDAQGNAGVLENWKTDVGTGWLDGIAVDYCGNVYIADYGQSKIFRISADAQYSQVFMDGTQFGAWTYLPNMDWGSGMGNWDDMKLYVPEGWEASKLFEVDIGIPEKPRY